MKQSNMILVGAILLGGAWLYMRHKKAKDAAAVADKPVIQERISEAVVSLQDKQKAAFPLAVRKEYDIIVPPAAVSQKVWDEVAQIQAEREGVLKLNVKTPVYI